MEDALVLAKAHGVYLIVGEQHEKSEASRVLIMKFLADMIALDTSRQTSQSGSVDTPVVVESDAEDENDDEEEEEEDDDEDSNHPLNKEAARLPQLHANMSSLGKRGFQYNPVCRKCKMQFDAANNKHGSCICHPGELEPEWSHDHFGDCDEWMDPQYEDGDPVDAYTWSCCSGFVDAQPCVNSKHEETGPKRTRL